MNKLIIFILSFCITIASGILAAAATPATTSDQPTMQVSTKTTEPVVVYQLGRSNIIVCQDNFIYDPAKASTQLLNLLNEGNIWLLTVTCSSINNYLKHAQH